MQIKYETDEQVCIGSKHATASSISVYNPAQGHVYSFLIYSCLNNFIATKKCEVNETVSDDDHLSCCLWIAVEYVQ